MADVLLLYIARQRQRPLNTHRVCCTNPEHCVRAETDVSCACHVSGRAALRSRVFWRNLNQGHRYSTCASSRVASGNRGEQVRPRAWDCGISAFPSRDPWRLDRSPSRDTSLRPRWTRFFSRGPVETICESRRTIYIWRIWARRIVPTSGTRQSILAI